jgi:hypothetical protein
MLCCMAVSVALSCWISLGGGVSSGCLSLGFLCRVGPLEQACSQQWSHVGLVNGQSPVS